MDDLNAQRTLVKSPPELWAEISEVEALTRRLGEFGEIRITRIEPETTVAWEGDRIRGTVTLEPSGWGTKVTLAAELLAVEVAVTETQVVEVADAAVEVVPEAGEAEPTVAEPVAEAVLEPNPAPEPVEEPLDEAKPEPVAVIRQGFFARLFGRKRPEAVAEAEEVAVAAVVPEPVVVASVPEPVVVPEAVVVPEPVAVPPEPEPASELVSSLPVPAAPVPVAPVLDAASAQGILVAALDDLGAAHHRPFSRLS